MEKMTMEQMLAEMESIAAKLESGACNLEESVALYERGVQLAAIAKEQLSKLQARINVVSEDGEKPLERN